MEFETIESRDYKCLILSELELKEKKEGNWKRQEIARFEKIEWKI